MVMRVWGRVRRVLTREEASRRGKVSGVGWRERERETCITASVSLIIIINDLYT